MPSVSSKLMVIDRMIVCVMGPSAAGKSTLAKRLQSWHPDQFARVPVDFFFVPRPAGITMSKYLASPFAYDWNALDRVLSTVGAGRTTPDCDFESLVWPSETGGLPISEAPVYLLDGMRPHPQCDLLVMLELDPGEQCRRLADRDIRWGTKVADRGPHLAATFQAGRAELPRAPDLRIRATDPLMLSARLVADCVDLRAHHIPGRVTC